jgi:catalase
VFWDYAAQNPESVHQFMVLFGDRGIPDGYRKMHGYIGHTHKLVNKNGDCKFFLARYVTSCTDLFPGVYVQLHFKSKQGTAFITQEDSANYSPDYSTKDLFQAIEKGDFPGWDVMVQTMDAKTAEEVWEKQGINVFDLTHVWPQGQFPLRKVGEFTLNENVQNYFAEVEQIAFNPAHLVPGIEPSADPVLQYDLPYTSQTIRRY